MTSKQGTITADASAALGAAAAGTRARAVRKEEPGMTGSALVLIIVPIVAFLALTAWLGMVFWADAHPEWKAHATAPGPDVTGAGALRSTAESIAPRDSELAPSLRDKQAA
jgi:hypothetical protein